MSGVNTITIIISKTKKKLEEAGATSEETASTPKELGFDKKWLQMSKSAGVVATKDGRYYLKSRKR